MRRRAFLGAVATVAMAGCTDLIATGGPGGFPDGDITMSAHSFDPAIYHASVGETVTWVNTSSRGHTITALDQPDGATYFATGGYGSVTEAVDAWNDHAGGRFDTGETFEHTFEVPGEHEYYCIPHAQSDMYGTVIVDG